LIVKLETVMKLFFKRKKDKVSSLSYTQPKKLPKPLKLISKILAILLVVLAILGFGMYLGQKYSIKSILPKALPKLTLKKEPKEDQNIVFFSEIYNLIKNNYWDKSMDDTGIANLYKLAIDKLTNDTKPLASPDETGIKKLVADIIKPMNEEQRKNFLTQLSDVVLQNLKPFGRSRLYVEKQVTDLTNQVKNVNPSEDLYANLGVTKETTQEQVTQTYESKLAELKAQPQTPEVQQKIASLQKAYDTIGDEDARKVYDTSGVESTVSYRLINPRIFYMHLIIFSPTTLQDINRASQRVDNKGSELDTLILDLRGNVGGLIDGLQYFLGPFIGNNQYAYQFFSRGETTDYKTKIGWLPSLMRYKKVIVLINGGCQSSTELFAVTLKKYNVGVLVGTKTKGWGTIEKVEPIKTQPFGNEKYSVLLVEQLTLREDGQSIEGLGVDPNINIANAGWEKELYQRFNNQEIVDIVKELLKPDIEALTKKP